MGSGEDSSDNDKTEIKKSQLDSSNKESEESLFALYDIHTPSSISIVSTNLPSTTEDKLQQVLLQKLEKRNDDISTSNSGMFRLNMESGPLSCYYHLVAQPGIVASDSNSSEFVHVGSHNALLVVLASPWEGLFELFSSEVEQFFITLQAYVDKKRMLEDLQSWNELCLEYTTRVVSTLPVNDLTVLLEVALRWGKIGIQNVSQTLESDIQKFLECCSFSLLDHSASERRILAEYDRNRFTLAPDLSSLSQTFAKELSLPECNIPVKVRQTIEWYKLKGIQDLNTLKRHIKKAVNDYYELNEANKFLSQSGYPFVLLNHAAKENDTTSEDEEIIQILKEHLAFKLM